MRRIVNIFKTLFFVCVFTILLSSCSKSNTVAIVDNYIITKESFQKEFDYFSSILKFDMKNDIFSKNSMSYIIRKSNGQLENIDISNINERKILENSQESSNASDFNIPIVKTKDELERENRINEEILHLKKDVLNEIIFEKLVTLSQDYSNDESDKIYHKLKEDIISSLGGEDGLKLQLSSYSISEQLLDDSLKKQSIIEANRNYIYKKNNPNDSDIKKFIKDNLSIVRLYDLVDITVPSYSLVAKIVERLNKNIDVDELIKQYNSDNLDNTSGKKLSKVGILDDDFISKKILDMQKDKVKYFKNNGLYHIIKVEKIYDDFNIISDNARKVYLDKIYRNYLKNLYHKHKIKVFEKNL